MTIREAIDRAGEMRPDTLKEETKRFWLAQLDGMLRREITALHEAGGDGTTGADIAAADDTVLLAAEPYSGIYLYWLMAQADLAQGELTRYANDMQLYNAALSALGAACKNQNRPLPRGQFRL